jgi:regulator of sigma E protease
MDVLAVDVAAWFVGIWSAWIGPILMLVVGLGLMIFVHEMGHFLVAKAVGIKVERFAIGFGKRLVGFHIGETDYCLCLFPLGGYVKMLGQEDFKPLPGQDAQPDPRSYMAKSVGARMAVISAGVAMNVVFGALLFVIVCLVGIRFTAPVLGDVLEGYPAARAKIAWQTPPAGKAATERGLKPGDKILEIDGKKVTRFHTLSLKAALADRDDTFRIRIEREIDGRSHVGTTVVGVKTLKTELQGERFAFGIEFPRDVTFAEPDNVATSLSPFRRGDVLLGVQPIPGGSKGRRGQLREIPHHWLLQRVAEEIIAAGELPTHTAVKIRRGADETEVIVPCSLSLKRSVLFRKGGAKERGHILSVGDNGEKVRIRRPDGSEASYERDDVILARDVVLDIAGMAPRLMAYGVVKDSPAEEAGLQAGDVIVDYGERGTPTYRELLERNKEFADSGTVIRVLRGGRLLDPVRIRPKARGSDALIGISPSLDVTHPVVASVREGSLARRMGVAPGDEITRINGQDVQGWIDVFNLLRAAQAQDKDVRLSLKRGEEIHLGKLDTTAFDPADYEMHLIAPNEAFQILMGPEVKKNPLAALVWGADQTAEFLLITYASLRGLMKGTLSTSQVRGPIGIGAVAVRVSRKGFVDFVYFMAIISVTLAVMNFLPIPVVDGGHAVFLIIEKIRGKPVPVKVQNIVQAIGILGLILVFVLVTWQDLVRIFKGLW